jgi:hypothetical protein
MDKSSLFKKDYKDLYKLYDESKNDLDKELIKEVVDSKALQETDIGFQSYPDYHIKDFQNIIYKKKEFNVNQLYVDASGIDDMCNSDFSIKAHQNFLKNFMTKESPYRSLLIYHGVGVGKTCSALTIAENFRDPYARKDKRILILSSKNIQIGWKQTIYNPIKGDNQCTGDTFVNSDATTDRQVNALVKQYYELMAYQSFSNFVKRMVNSYVLKYPKEEKDIRKKEWIRSYFSNRYIIIDEVHNIRGEHGTDMRDAVKTIEEVITYSDNLRLVLLTATPMYNRVTEILWILNMMLLNDKRPILEKKNIFDKNDELTPQGAKLIQDKCRGYVSYLRGENPITFPIRLYPNQIKDRNGKSLYTNNKMNTLINKSQHPTYNLVGGSIKDNLKFLNLFGSKLHGLQYNVYKKSIQNIIDKDSSIDLDIRGEMNPILDTIPLTQISNMIYPSEKDNLIKEIQNNNLSPDEFYGLTGLKNCMNKVGNKYTYKKKVLEQYGPIFDLGKLHNYSSKIASIIKIINDSEGIVFIYTNYVNAGIIPLQLTLEQNGYKKHKGEDILKYPEWNKSADKFKTKREPMSFDGQTRSHAGDTFQQGKYMVIDASISKNLLQQQIAIVNSKDNMNGEKIKVIIGTVVASEGLDFKRIRSVHILDPWLHLNRIEQTIGRAIRFCSHSDLESHQKNVLIYLHVSVLPDTRESIDISIYRYAEKKSIQIGKVEMVLKRNAIDRYLYKDVNVIEKGTIQSVQMKPPLYSSSHMRVDPSDTSYSKVCSYSKDCNYNEDLTIDEQPILNNDTFIEHYSSSFIRNIQKKIALLFREFYVYDIHSIVGLLNEFGYNQIGLLYSALHEMILNKYIIHDKYGHIGYIINSDIYYLYQPISIEDESIPLYYRMNIKHPSNKPIQLPRLEEIDISCNCSKSYSVEEINNVYITITQLSKDSTLVSIVNHMKEVYKDISLTHSSIAGYIFDRLPISDKYKLMYGYIHELSFPDYEIYETLQTILRTYLIYKSDNTNDYYFNNELTSHKHKHIFGFVFLYKNKPCFYEYYEHELTICNQLQLDMIQKSMKRYISSNHCKTYKKTTPIWGYTIIRNKEDCVLKFVKPGDNIFKFPPGPGNVCISDNRACRLDILNSIFSTYYPELVDLVQIPSIQNKISICCLFEVVLRYTDSLYPYDTLWIKFDLNII